MRLRNAESPKSLDYLNVTTDGSWLLGFYCSNPASSNVVLLDERYPWIDEPSAPNLYCHQVLKVAVMLEL